MLLFLINAILAQLAERRTCNADVEGSSPSDGLKYFYSYIKQEFKDYMAFFPDIEELITGIITKDLNLGMSIVSINKILKVLDLDSSQLAISNWFHK